MVRLTKSAQRLELTAPAYSLTFDRERPWTVTLGTGTGEPLADLFVASSVDTSLGRDDLDRPGEPELSRQGTVTTVTFRSRSACWDQKVYQLCCTDGELTYQVAVSGKGRVDQVHYLQGTLASDAARLGLGPSRFRAGYERPYGDLARGSRPHFGAYFSPRPTAAERDLRLPVEEDSIDLCDDPLRHGGCDSFLPALWGTAWELPDGPWTAVGLAPEPAALQFGAFRYRGGSSFGFDLDYGGRVAVEGTWQAPPLLFTFGARDVYGAFRGQVAALEGRGLVHFPDGPFPAWWAGPVYDTTAQQCWLARGREMQAQNTLANALDALALLEQQGLRPGTICLGPGWQDDTGRPDPLRWPDLAGFIARQHEAGRKVVLTWTLFGRLRLHPTVARQTVAPDGLDADGLRLIDLAPPDGSTGTLRSHLAAVRAAVREVKPDALIVAPTVNPYFADLVDMVPLGGLWSDRHSVVSLLRHRAALARLVSPHWHLAVEDRHAPNLEAWREVVQLQPELGVPWLGCVEGLEQCAAPLEPADLRTVAERWQIAGW
ncbi:MAG: hypothetical protein IT204_17335 [Fimbriimonadaceae bacterium]|nr:hypothetical protein [Fimbriimonadaceae bacterium]